MTDGRYRDSTGGSDGREASAADAVVRSCAESHVAELAAAIDGFGRVAETAAEWGERLAHILLAGGRLLAAGNGGSAAQAQHLTGELVGRYRDDRRPFSAICLSAETSSLTAIANDYPAIELFARQVEAHGRAGDVLALLSTSGSSPNIVEAASRARRLGIEVWAFTGPAPNPLAELADRLLAVDAGTTAAVQELHLVALHVVCEALDAALALPPFEAALDATPVDGAPNTPANCGNVVREPGQESATFPQFTGRVEEWQAERVAERVAEAPDGGSAPRRIVVVGDALLDVDLTGVARRLSPDAPVPVLDDLVERPRPGGAALAAAMAARDGHQVTLITALDDEAGRLVERLLGGVQVVQIPYSGRTATKRRIRSGGQSLLRLDSDDVLGEYGPLPDEARQAISNASAVLVSDYGRGLTGHSQLRAALAGRPRRVALVWDPHPRGAAPIDGAQVLTPNESEAAQWAARLTSAQPPRSDGVRPGAAVGGSGGATRLATVRAHADALVQTWSAHAVAVTLGAGGALLSYGEGAPVVTPAPPVSCLDSCGAGDRFAVSVAEGLAEGLVTAEAVQAAVDAAASFVSSGGAAALCEPPYGEGRQRGASRAQPVGESGPVGRREDGPAEALALAARARANGATLVATGGCFDLLHAGHIATLQAASRLGDHLVVLLNSDESVRRLKGPGRPLVPAADRARVLAALEYVDAVLIFDEDTPTEALRLLKPHVWAKGGDYAGRDLPEAAALEQWGGQAVALPYLGGRSTSELVRTAARSAGPSSYPAGPTTPAAPQQSTRAQEAQ